MVLVTFTGSDASAGTQIHDLVANHHVGGVVLLAGNDNFAGGEETLNQSLGLNRQLQLIRWSLSQPLPPAPPTATLTSTVPAAPLTFIPLFVGLPQEGDGAPLDQLNGGVTTLPSMMALGATWNALLAQQVGNVMGSELRALGINLLLGPSLDVMEAPHPESGSDLGCAPSAVIPSG